MGAMRYAGFFCVFLGLINLARADDSWDINIVRAYVHNSEMQRRWAMASLAPHLKTFRGDEKVLDIGCGDGKITADISRFLPEGFVVGIDPSKAMLDWARKQYSSSDYSNLVFHKGDFLNPQLNETFDFIFSSSAIQYASDQVSAFKRLHALLKSGGKLLITLPSMDNPAWKKARKSIQESLKWSSYWQSGAPRHIFLEEEYLDLLDLVHLGKKSVKKIETVDPFVDRLEFLAFLLATHTSTMPFDQGIDFCNELIDEYIRLLPEALLPNGVIEARFGRLEIEAIKE